MKKLYTLILIVFIASSAFPNTIIKAVSNGNWKTASTWDLNRVPADGDTVVIPATRTVVIDNIQNLGSDFLYLEILGKLKFDGGKLWLDEQSVVVIFSGGSIVGTGSSSETLKIDGVNKFWGHDDDLIVGPAFASAATGSSPIGFTLGSNSPLPVKFISFNVAHKNNDVLVQWTTSEELNSSYYEIQRSENTSDWNTVGTVMATGNTTITHSYTYTDKNVSAKIVYYRIRQVDIDGKFVVTPVQVIKNETGNGEIKITSMASNSVSVHFSEQIKSNVIIRVTSASGQVLSQRSFDQPVGQVTIPAQNANKGIYIVTITDGQSLKLAKQVLL